MLSDKTIISIKLCRRLRLADLCDFRLDSVLRTPEKTNQEALRRSVRSAGRRVTPRDCAPLSCGHLQAGYERRMLAGAFIWTALDQSQRQTSRYR